VGYVLLLLATLSWSFVGVLVKSASVTVDSTMITFARFFLGIVFLGAFLLLKNGRIQLRSAMPWIWLGAIGKSCNYYFENMAISIGYSYGNMLVPPIQTVTLLLVTTLWLREQVGTKGWIAAAMCLSGVVVIGWNGDAAGLFTGKGGLTTVLYAAAGIGAAVHVLSQKMLVQSMDPGNMNFSIFFWCSILMAIPIPFQPDIVTGPVTAWTWMALALLGLITGLSFNWFAEALRRVSFPIVIIISNSTAVFMLLWSYLFYREPITLYIVAGAAVFIAGIVLLNLPLGRTSKEADG
jgi:drug/metabolite transporter (DMT)-like permease